MTIVPSVIVGDKAGIITGVDAKTTKIYHEYKSLYWFTILIFHVFTVYCKNYRLGAPEITLDFSGVRVVKSLVFCVVFCHSLSVCPFTFDYCINDKYKIISVQA